MTRSLLLQQCVNCRKFQYLVRPFCVFCRTTVLSAVAAAGTGTVDSFTVVHRAETPYTLARVRLTEGPILLTHLIDNPEPRCDQPVRLAWRGDLPVFRPVE
ncbi:OB-fold domain-containing protein [Actinoplanes sp. NPDC051861]|uniref:Zn-ribbon domain-containing OB-fold protein n=1 Tax=Actinoplanes sp. NPDC051861 TaxID=3155170 RepID=UPI00342A0024